MAHWYDVAGGLLGAIKIALGLLFIRFWIRTRFWVPKYVHWMAAIALLIGFGMLAILPETVNRGRWPSVTKALIVLFFPAVVYVAFVFYGGQQAAYDARSDRIACPHCRASQGVRGTACTACGQTIA